jgi:hypothetical protein
MSQITADIGGGAGHGGDNHGHAPIRIDPALVTLQAGAGQMVSNVLLLAGVVGMVFTIVGGFSVGARHALMSYLVGATVSLGFALGSLGYVMIFQQVNAGWIVTCRRQFETAATLIPFCALLFLPVLVFPGRIYEWMSPEHTSGDVLAVHKAPYLNTTFWFVRFFVFFGLWTIFAFKLYGWSRQQDVTGDKWLTARARRMSSYGLLIFALTSAFASFDWLMGLDYHWFSTMFGVWFFTGNILSATCLCVLALGFLRLRGKLAGLVTEEHFHDLGKLVLVFTVFWAYISFCQYFLIWYSNIPEETAWFNVRKTHGWENFTWILAFGHFLAPFLVLLWKGTKRSTRGLMLVATWMILMHIVDVFFVVRPATYPGRMGLEFWWLDLCGIIGPIGVFLGVLVRQMGKAPLIPMKDPRLPEALHHRNYM